MDTGYGSIAREIAGITLALPALGFAIIAGTYASAGRRKTNGERDRERDTRKRT